MAIKQHSDLIRFVSTISISSDGSVPLNSLENSTGFVSLLYEPEYRVSILSTITLGNIRNNLFSEISVPIRPDSITGLALSSDLSTYAPDIYLLLRLVVLESFSLVYSIREDKDNLRYITKKDIQRIKNNINYLADYMGTEEKYFKMVEPLRDMYIALGYIEHQIDVILESGRSR